MPFRYFSPYEYFVIGFPDTPHVPMPTRPFTLSGDAKMLLTFTAPDFFVFFVEKLSHLFLSCSRSSSKTLNRCCFFAFFRFKYSLLFGRCRLQKKRQKKTFNISTFFHTYLESWYFFYNKTYLLDGNTSLRATHSRSSANVVVQRF